MKREGYVTARCAAVQQHYCPALASLPRRLGITTEQQSALKRLTEAQEEGSRLGSKITIGVATETQIRAQLARELQTYIDKHLLDPRDTLAMADAQTVLGKRLQQMSDQAHFSYK
jgi:hypothetical protein